MLRTCLFSALLVLISPTLVASGATALQLTKPRLDITNIESLQRGAAYFFNKCTACHSASLLRYNRMAKDLGLTEQQITAYLPATAKITDGIQAALSAAQGTAAYGVAPPDLSLKAREHGTTWLFNFFTTFYEDSNAKGGSNNLMLPGTAMPNQFMADQGLQQPVYAADTTTIIGVAAQSPGGKQHKQFHNTMQDLVNFLDYVGEPAKIQRVTMGKWVIGFLFILLGLFWLLKRDYWLDIRK